MMRKRSQQQLAEYQHKMFRAVQLASLGTISATVAHELNQPLTVMRLFLQQNLRALSQPDADHAKISESIEETLEEISNAESIVNRFRRFARKSSPTAVTQVNLSETAERVVASLAESARKAKLEIEVEFDDVATISGNAAEFEQVFFVLIQNAIQASVPFKDQHLKIKAEQSESHVMITFSDDCGGVAEEYAEKIFEPFFTTKPETGTGLGLCILDRIIKRYRGELKIENISGQGITFNIKLPIDV
jgi:C4-dicarboxylate-specific signal transduction histidine kinase